MDTTKALRYDYRKTWEAFSRHTNTAHRLAASGDKAALEAEMRMADEALAAHKEARDRLAAAMIPALAFPGTLPGKIRPTTSDTWPTHRHRGTVSKGAAA